MSSEKLSCVICNKNDDKVIAFVEKTLNKSHEVLEIRKHHELKYNNVVLPVIPNLTDGYHTSCYKIFLALMKKYYDNAVIRSNVFTPIKDNLLSDDSPQQSTFEASTSATTVELSTFPAEPSTSTLQPSKSTVEAATLAPQPSTSTLKSCTSTSETHLIANDEANITDSPSTPVDNIDENSEVNPKICIFCDKNLKKHQGQRQPLPQVDKEILIKSLENYHTVEELETEATFASSSRFLSCPEGIITADGLCTGVAYDNFDRFVDTASGKNTLHDTVGIIYQNVHQLEHSEDDVFDDMPEEIVPDEIPDNNDNQEQSENGNSNDKTRKKNRRRKFEAITPDLQPFSKKIRLSETLLSSSDERRSISVASLQKVKKLDVLWMLSHALKIPNIPMWVGFNSQFVEDINSSRQKICYLTPINESPTAKNVVLETLKETQKIATEVKQSEIAVTYDLAIAKIAMQIQSIEKPLFDNVFIHLGSFHIMMAYFKAVGKFISDCGLTNVAVESGIIASGSVDSFISGKHFNRCKRLYPLMALGLEILHFQFFLETEKITIPENFETELIAVNNHDLSYDALLNNSEVSEIISAYSAFKEASLTGVHGITPKFYMIYINLVSYYQILSRINQPNYARWLVRYHENLIKLEETHPQLYENMERGHFGIQRTDKSFSRQPIDLTLEQTINADVGRRLTGVIHFTNSISARQRWCKSHEIRSTIISHTYEVTGLRKHTDVTADLERYNIRRDSKHLQSFVDAFSKFMNPFDAGFDKLQLFNISSGKAAAQAVQDYLVNIEEDGKKLREQFITECSESPDRFEKSIPRVKIMNFSNETVKKSVKSGNKVQEIKMQRDLFGRLLGLSLDYKIDKEKFLCYPVTPLPMSMCRLDGSLYQTDKSEIVKCFEKQHKCTDAPKTFDIVIVDGFFLLHTMHDIPATFGGISKKIMNILTAFKALRVDIVFDQYFVPSIKDYERTRRNEQKTIDFKINGPSQTRPTDFMKELKNIKFKESFVQFLIEYWATDEMATFIGNTLIKLNYDSCYSYIVKNNSVEMTIDEDMTCNNHEEADTKIISPCV
ncbi:hypothetical protein ACJJTC_016455 [Scirpophaga incertulas]